MKYGLGTQLRQLLELLDGDLERSYAAQGLDYRPRYTPVVRALMDSEPLTVGEIAKAVNMSQPAATQTLALMLRQGWVEAEAAPTDARQRLMRLSPKARAQLPQLRSFWAATGTAADELDAELSSPLSALLAEAIAALQQRSFTERRSAAARRRPASSPPKQKKS